MLRIQWMLLLTAIVTTGRAWAYEPAGTPDDWPVPIPDRQPFWMVLGDRLELRFGDEKDTYILDAQGWFGGDYNRLWVKTEGEGEQGDSPESVELQLLYSRRFARYWDWQIGIRQDFEPKPDRQHVVLGLQGVAPYEFEWDSALFVSEDGDISARLEVEYDLRVTQRLVVQPRVELNASADTVPEYGLGSGLNNSELGIRLRYEFVREFAPYIGVSWEKRYGETADLARQEGEPTSGVRFLFGVRLWF